MGAPTWDATAFPWPPTGSPNAPHWGCTHPALEELGCTRPTGHWSPMQHRGGGPFCRGCRSFLLTPPAH